MCAYVLDAVSHSPRICIILCLYIFIRRSVYAMPSYFVHIHSHSCHGRMSTNDYRVELFLLEFFSEFVCFTVSLLDATQKTRNATLTTNEL